MRNVIACIGVVCCAGMASAATIVVNQGAYSQGLGGEFNAVLSGVGFSPIGLTESGSFETFCLEVPENYQPGTSYLVTIDSAADGGGAGGQVGMTDPLDERTAYLYSMFISGGLAQYDYSNGLGERKNDAGALQEAIWFLENEIGSVTSAKAAFFLTVADLGIGMGIGNARVANLYDNAGGKHQSMILVIPTPGAFAALAFAGVAAGRRRR